MMKKIVFFLLLTLVICMDSPPKYKYTVQPRPRLKNILLEVESLIKAGKTIDVTMAYLDNLKAMIDDEQIRHDQLFTQQKNQCAGEISLRQKDIKDAEQVNSRGSEQYETCHQSELKSQSELENILSSQKTTDGDIKILETIRTNGNQLFEAKKQDIIDGLRTIADALKQLEEYNPSSSSNKGVDEFAQISMKLVEDSVRTKTTHLLAGLTTTFLQVMGGGGFQEAYDELKSQLEQLEKTLYKTLEEQQNEEDNSISEYDYRRTHLIDYYNNLKRSEKDIRDHISAMTLCEDQQTAILESSRGKKIRNSQILDSAQRMCNDFQGEYEKATKVRQNEINMIAEVKQAIQERTSTYKGKQEDSF